MKFEELVSRAEAYEKLLEALRRCSPEAKREIVDELNKEFEGNRMVKL